MATSSLYKSFTILNKKEATNLIKLFDQAEKNPPEPTRIINTRKMRTR